MLILYHNSTFFVIVDLPSDCSSKHFMGHREAWRRHHLKPICTPAGWTLLSHNAKAERQTKTFNSELNILMSKRVDPTLSFIEYLLYSSLLFPVLSYSCRLSKATTSKTQIHFHSQLDQIKNTENDN